LADDTTPRYGYHTVLAKSFDASMGAGLRSTIDDIVAWNKLMNQQQQPDLVVQIYRLGPVIARDASPELLDFDGHFDALHSLQMSLYDWFMHGYVDASGGVAARDPVITDYKRTGPRLGCRMTALSPPPHPGYWRATTQAVP
jgi:hypothetical protein